MMDKGVLVIHLGGLGDVCLSESTFYSLRLYFGHRLEAVGYTRFLGLFAEHFQTVCSVEERRWLWLFSDAASPPEPWDHIVLVGKDAAGEMRRRLQALTAAPLVFIDAYPDAEQVHVEEYQLRQLAHQGITPLRKDPPPRGSGRVILYPERSYRKAKWPIENFLELHATLAGQDIPTEIVEPHDLAPAIPGACRFGELADVKTYLSKGGIFVSNDCGIAHVAGACGLSTLTLFHDFDPAVWRPRGRCHAVRCDKSWPSVDEVFALIRDPLFEWQSNTDKP
jgi:ADP-heptose:LPS heptosyltransferase